MQEKSISFKKISALDAEIKIIDYQKSGLSTNDLNKLSQELNLPISKMIRKEDDFFKKRLKNNYFSKEEWLMIVSENLQLLKRPIIKIGHKAIIGETEDAIDTLLSEKNATI